MSKTLSVRGRNSALVGRSWDRYRDVTADLYHSETNKKGLLEMGVSENVGRLNYIEPPITLYLATEEAMKSTRKWLMIIKFLMQPDVAEHINENFHIDSYTVGYGDGCSGSKRLKTVMAKLIANYFNPFSPVVAEHLVFASGLTSINEMLAFTLMDEGDAILVCRPVYAVFDRDFTIKARLKMIYVPMEGIDPLCAAASHRVEHALIAARESGTRVRALILCNPHNPLGRCYPPQALKAYMALCQKHKIHLISDEIYALSIFDSKDSNAVPFTSVLAIDSTNLLCPDYLHVLYGMSKDFAASGLRLGCICTQNTELRYALKAISAYHWVSGPSTAAAESMLGDTEWVTSFIKHSRSRIAENYRHATALLRAANIPYYQGGNAGFFLWCDFRAYLPAHEDGFEAEQALFQKFIEAKVLLATGESFHSEIPGWFRIIFTLPKDQLEEGIRRIVSVLHAEVGGSSEKWSM